jgi:DNA invertase Pin-like site-specific DNA recombinase
MKRAAIYARQSLDRTGEALGVTRQLEDCRKLCADNGWTVTGEYVDNDTSASGRKPRPQYRRMLEALSSGGVDVVVSWSADRLTRKPIEVEELIDLVEAHRVKLATVSGEVDLSTPYGRAIARIFGAIARQEVEQKGARQKRANLQRAENGHAAWTRRPYGYDLDKHGRIKVVADEAKEIRTAATAVLNGATLASITADLNNRGKPTSAGGRWSVTTLRRGLLNPRHAGRVTYKGQDVADGSWPTILDLDTHRALVATLTDPRRRTQTGTAHKYLLSGLAICGRCAEPMAMFASPMGVKGDYWMVYRCRTAHLARRLDLVDEVVTSAVLARLAMPDAASLLIEDVDVTSLRDDAQGLRRRLDELAGLLADGVLTAAGVRDASGRLKEQLRDVEQQIASAARSNDLGSLVTATDVKAVWERLPLRVRRQVVDLLCTVTILPAGKGARFTPDQVKVTWR